MPPPSRGWLDRNAPGRGITPTGPMSEAAVRGGMIARGVPSSVAETGMEPGGIGFDSGAALRGAGGGALGGLLGGAGNPLAALFGGALGALKGITFNQPRPASMADYIGRLQSAVGSRTTLGGNRPDKDRGIVRLPAAMPGVIQTPTAKRSRPPYMTAPLQFNFDSGMTPLQLRAALATFGTQGESGSFRDPEALAYYRNLIERDALDDSGTVRDLDILPIERQYLMQAFGFSPFNSTQELLDALASY